MDLGNLKVEDLKFFVNSGLGFLILAGVLLVVWLKRRNGNSLPVLRESSVANEATFSQLERVIAGLDRVHDDLRDLSQDMAVYERANEKAAQERHLDWTPLRLMAVTTIKEWNERKSA
jgi:hypothetical protein